MSELVDVTPRFDGQSFRSVLGNYPTGVVVVTAFDQAGTARGMTLGTFSSVSLDPPMIAFMPSVTSSSWAELEATGESFCVNILAADQEDVCVAVATRKVDKFEGLDMTVTPGGNPLIVGSLAFIDCEASQKHQVGDHFVIYAEVQDLGLLREGAPLVFLGGGYGSFLGKVEPVAGVAVEVDLLAHLLHLPTWSDWPLGLDG